VSLVNNIILITSSVFSRSSRKRPPREFRKVATTRADRLQEWALVSDHMMKQWPLMRAFSVKLHMLMVTNSFIVIILNSFLLPITEEVHVGTSQRTFRTCVMYYSKFEQELSAFIKVLTKWSLMRT